MTDLEKLCTKIETYIQKCLKDKTPFKDTSDFIAYIARKEQAKKSKLKNQS